MSNLILPPVLSMGRGCEAAWLAERYLEGSPLWEDVASGRYPMDIQRSTSAEPIFQRAAPTAGVYFPGSAGNNIAMPDDPALRLRDDFDLRVCVRPNSWNSTNNLLVRYNNSGNRIWSLRLDSGKLLSLRTSTSGSGVTSTINSTEAVPFSGGQIGWVRVIRVASTGAVTFYTSLDGVSWTQLGDTQTGDTGSLHDSTEPIIVGENLSGGGTPFLGMFYRVQAFASVDGSNLVLDADLTDRLRHDLPNDSFLCSTGQVAILNRTTAGHKIWVVDSPAGWQLATNDYMDAGNVLDVGGMNFTAAVAFRRSGNTGAQVNVFGKKNAAGASSSGWQIALSPSSVLTFRLAQGGTQTALTLSGASGPRVDVVAIMVRNAEKNLLTAYSVSGGGIYRRDSAAFSGALSPSNNVQLRIGSAGGTPSNFMDGNIFGAAFFSRAVESDSEILELARALLGGRISGGQV
jgi:hypothetical protein